MGFSIFQLLPPLLIFLSTFFYQQTQAIKKPYIVYLGSHSHGLNPSSLDMDSATDSHYDLLSSVLGSHEKAKEAIFYSYNKHINGFAALLEEEEAEEIKKNKNVVSVFVSKMHKLHTTRSWAFLQQERNRRVNRNSAWKRGRFGQNTIIANIDTGVWPESKSFSDKGYGGIPSKWRGGGICQINNLPTSNKTLCNNKLIGARIFNDGYKALYGAIDPAHHNSARDIIGHGTHTLSTAAGNFVRGANVLGNGNGTAKGGSPRARVASYKACWDPSDEGGCVEADLLAAFDQAISDGVDVLSVSVGAHKEFPESLLTDGISIGAFHAVAKGVVVVCSAGNEGPDLGTVKNVAPWTLTVGASSLDREFGDLVTLSNGQRIKGVSLSTGLSKFFPLISAGNAKFRNATIRDAQLCKAGTLDPNKVNGKILICQRGRSLRPVRKGLEAKLAGAKGMVLEDDEESRNLFTADIHVLPTSNIKSKVPRTRKNDTNGGSGNGTEPLLLIGKARTSIGLKPAPLVASFSARGLNVIQPLILKPDVIAPGLDILAAYSEGASPTNIASDRTRLPFNVLSGTSMACPHVAGIAGLLKTRYPNWTPAAIKSAIMTTATTRDNTNRPIRDQANNEVASPLTLGSGHIRPNLAIDPGLVYDINPSEYLNYLCASGYEESLVASFNFNNPYKCPKSYNIIDFNYPSITLSHVGVTPINVTRTVTNVGSPRSTYSLSVQPPRGIKVDVEPRSLRFGRRGEKKSFKVVLKAMDSSAGEKFTFGEFSWSDGKHIVRSPIVVLGAPK